MGNPVATNLAIQPVDTGKTPPRGAKAVPVNFDFSTGAIFDVDLTQLKNLGQIEIIQSIFIDNSQNNQAITVTVANTTQSIAVGPTSQGVYPILVTDKAKFTVSSAGNGKAQIQLINAALPPAQWASSAVQFNPVGTVQVQDAILDATVTNNKVQVLMTEAPDTVTDNSGSVGVANTVAAAANANRQEFLIQNLSLAATLGINIGAAAAIGSPGTITLGPLASIRQPGTGAINVIADTAATPFTLKQW
jgi:hypothetical protein